MAIGVLRAARERGLRVPEDLSVIGIDDHEMADFFDLTTVAQPVHEQGRVAAQQVLGALSSDDWEPEQVVLPTDADRASVLRRRRHRRYARSVIDRPAARPLRSNLVTGRSAHRSTTPPVSSGSASSTSTICSA